MNKKPPELHLIDGTRSRRGNEVLLPVDIRKRIPKAEWLDDPDAWDKTVFVEETAEFLFDVYGIGNDLDRHTLAMLAEQIDLYVQCSKAITLDGILLAPSDAHLKANPLINVRTKTLTLILKLMSELGLTPRSRLPSSRLDGCSEIEELMRGP